VNPSTDSSYCVTHPLEPAQGTCPRCGSFTCDRCAEPGANGLCPACRARLGDDGAPFPLARTTWSMGALWSHCWARFTADWLMLSVAVLIVAGCSGACSLVGQIGQLGVRLAAHQGAAAIAASMVVLVGVQVVLGIVQGLFQLGLILVVLDAVRGKRVDLARIFQAFAQWRRYTVLMLIVGVAALLIIGALAVVGIAAATLLPHATGALIALFTAEGAVALVLAFWAMPCAFATFELAYNPEAKPTRVLSNCFAIVRDNRWNALGVFFVAGLAACVGLLACCVGIIPGAALAQVIIAGLFLSLRNGCALPTD